MLKRAFGGDFLTYGILGALTKSASVVTLPLFASKLSPTDFGLLDAFALSVALIGILSSLQVESALLRFFPDATTPDEQAAIYWTGLIFLSCLSIVAAVLLLVLAPAFIASTPYQDQSTLLAACIAFQLPLSLLLGFNTTLFRAQRRKLLFGLLSAFNIGVSAALGLLYVLGLGGNAAGLIACNTAALTLTVIVSFMTARAPTAARFDSRVLQAMLRFSAPLLPVSLAIYAQQWLSRVIVLAFLGLADAGVYSIALRIASPFLLVANTLKTSWTPLVYQSYKEVTFRDDANRIAVTIALAGTLLLLLTTLFRDEIVNLLFNEYYASAAYLIHLVAMSFYLKILSGYVSPTLAVAKKTGIIGVTTLAGTVISIGGMFVLIPDYGVVGVAGSAIVGECCSLLLLLLLAGDSIQRYLDRNIVLVAMALPIVVTLAVAQLHISFVQELLVALAAAIVTTCAWIALGHRVRHLKPN